MRIMRGEQGAASEIGASMVCDGGPVGWAGNFGLLDLRGCVFVSRVGCFSGVVYYLC